MSNNEITNRLARLLLEQSGLLKANEPLKDEVKVPASIGDILTSKKYWESKRFKQK